MSMSRKNRKMKQKQNAFKLETVDVSEVRTDTPIVHDELPAEFVQRLSAVFDVIKPHLRAGETLTEFITEFRKDVDPEREIKIWEKIAHAYSTLNIPSLPKQKIFETLLGISMNGTGDPQIKAGLTKAQFDKIVDAYKYISTN